MVKRCACPTDGGGVARIAGRTGYRMGARFCLRVLGQVCTVVTGGAGIGSAPQARMIHRCRVPEGRSCVASVALGARWNVATHATRLGLSIQRRIRSVMAGTTRSGSAGMIHLRSKGLRIWIGVAGVALSGSRNVQST